MQKKTKILLVIGSVNQGGAEFQLLSLANLFQLRGLDVEVLALTDYDHFLPYIAQHKLKYSCVSNEGSNFKRLRKGVRQIIEKKPDLVISYMKIVSQTAILARVVSGFRFKLVISERTSLLKPWHDKFYFNLALFANAITVNSVSKIRYIKERYPLLKSRTFFIPNIINIDRFNLVTKELCSKRIRISFVGRISPEKNLINLIKAVKIVTDKGHEVNLSLTGAANSKGYMLEITSLISALDLQHIVSYDGLTKDVTEVYRKTDLLCLVSIFEGFSNVLSEAISCGLPVIASNIEENRLLVEDGVNGFLIDPNDATSLADGIENFLKLKPEEIIAMSESNKQKAKLLFDGESIYRSYVTIFKKIGISDIS